MRCRWLKQLHAIPAHHRTPIFLEFLGSWHTGNDRWVDPFYVGEVPALETGEHDAARQRSEAAGQTQKQSPETTLESSRKGTKRTDVTVPQKDMKP